MENKATDKEIKKALERCTSIAYRGVCKDCAYVKFKMTDQGCLTPMLKDVLDLVNRLEKDRVEIDNFARAICGERLLKGKKVADFEDLQEYIKKQKSEAVKEFAERLKAVSHPYADTQMVFELQIDNLVKEMVGEE